MKKQVTLLTIACAAVIGASAGNGLKVYINPGHGGHDSNDRNVVIEPYAQGDPNGYWESNSNLEKGLALRDLLQAEGYKVEMSRVTNTTADDLGLSTIVSLGNKSQADVYFSIHSNATGTTARRNFPLMLFRGYDDEPQNPKAKELCAVLNKHLLENQVTYWTSTATNIRGDWSFYKSWGTQGLGALRGLTITGMLSEGSFHDYIPEAYRLMNKDFCWLEAYHFRRTVDEFLNQAGTSDKGHIFGRLNDSRSPRPGNYLKYGDDTFATIQTATVDLYDATDAKIDSYVTETINTNGVYCFKNLAPGTYTLKTTVESHYDAEATVTVKADEVSYANFKLNKIRSTPPEVLEYSPVWKQGDEGLLCNVPVTFQFNWDMDTELTEKAFSITPAVEGKLTWEDLNHRMVFTPTKPYDISTTYTVTLSTAATHAGGMTMLEPVTFSFATTDRNFMDVIGQSPREGESIHYKNAAVEFRFDKRPNFNRITSQISCTDQDGKAVKFNTRGLTTSPGSLDYGYCRMPFLEDLEIGKTYTVHLAGDIADTDGLTIPNPIDVTFTTFDAGTEKDGLVTDEVADHKAFVFNDEQSQLVKSQKVATDSKKALFGKSVNFTYTFEGSEGGEALWNNTADQAASVKADDIITVHINGDLSENSVYFMFTSESFEKLVPVCDLTFIGWRTFDVPLSSLEGTEEYRFSGVKVLQNPAMQSVTGTIGVDRLYIKGGSGIDEVTVPGLKVNVNSEFIVANADCFIQGIELVGLGGQVAAATSGNALYVGNLTPGHYIALIYTAAGRTAHRVVVAH